METWLNSSLVNMFFFFYTFLTFSAFKCSSDFTEVEWDVILDDVASFDQDKEKIPARDNDIIFNLNTDEYVLKGNEILTENDLEIFFNSDILKSITDDFEQNEIESLPSNKEKSISSLPSEIYLSGDEKVETLHRTPITCVVPVLNDDDTLNNELLRGILEKINGTEPQVEKRDKTKSSSIYKQDYLDMKNAIMRKIKEQLPCAPIRKLRDYEIQNWPDGIDPTANYWTKVEIEMIKEKFNDLKFFYHPLVGKNRRQVIKKIDLKLSDNDFARILTRFRTESGFHNAKIVEWDMLDRSQLPKEFSDIKSYSNIINIASAFGFMENLHFYRYASFYLSRLVQPNSSLCAVDYYFACKSNLLEKFKQESRHENAKRIEWSRIDLSRLPEKFRKLNLSNAIVFDCGLFKDPEFFENIYFLEFCDLELKILAQKSESRKKRKMIEA